jgi:hypothetical protein
LSKKRGGHAGRENGSGDELAEADWVKAWRHAYLLPFPIIDESRAEV